MKLRTIFSIATALGAAVALAQTPLRQARVTQVINDVKILPGQAEAKPAVVNDEVREGTAVRTGTESRSELTFGDLSIARLGANTIFSFDQGTRSVELGGGAILLRVPKDSGGGRIKTAAITAAITGTTVMAEYNCEDTRQNRIQSRCPDANFKFIVLEGSMRICKTGGARECVNLGPGQMLAGSIDQPLGDPIDIDLARLLETSLLIRGFPPILSEDLIANAVRAQASFVGADLGYLSNTMFANLIDAQDQRTAALASPSPTIAPSPSPSPTASPSPSPQPTPQKFGTPPVITSSVPYTITSGTTIITDPTITTNGVTDEGRIYRDPASDGPASSYFFSTTSAFDTASGFDQQFATGPISTFKFASLQLAGNPTISTANNGPTRLALISVGNMTTAAPGGALTFAGIQQLLLATQNGSITLGSVVSFQNIPSLFIYARGAMSTLTVDSPISGTRDLVLQSEGDVRATGSLSVSQAAFAGQTTGRSIVVRAGTVINIGGNLSLTTAAGNIQNGGNIIIRSGGDMMIGGSLQLTVTAGSNTTTGTGGNIDVRVGGSLSANSISLSSPFGSSLGVTNGANTSLDVGGNLTTTSGGISFSHATPVGGSPATLVNGGNLTLTVAGNLVTPSGATLLMDLVNTSGSTVNTGANILASVGGNLTTGTLTLRSSNSSSGATQNGSNITLNVGGALNVSTFSATFNNSNSGTVGTGANLLFNLGSLNASSFATSIDNRFGGSIATGGNLTLNVAGNLTTTSATSVTFLVNNGGTTAGQAGSIGTGGNVSLTIGGGFTASSVSATLENRSGGMITNGGNLMLDVGGSLTTTAGVTLLVNNGGTTAGQGGNIGTGGNASLVIGGSVSASTISATLENRSGGMITNGGNLTLDVGGNLTTTSTTAGVTFLVNNGGTTAGQGGNIGTGGNASLMIGGSVSASTISATLENRSGGMITNGGNLTLDVGGNLTTTSTTAGVTFLVHNGGNMAALAGSIGTGGNIRLSVGGDTNVRSINATVTNTTGGSIGTGGNVSFLSDGSVTVAPNNTLGLLVTNNSGSIGNGGNVLASIANAFNGGVNIRVSNNGGSIGTGGNVGLELGGNFNADADGGLTLRVSNNGSGSIGMGGNVSADVAGNFTGGTINARVQNNSMGVITEGGNVTVNIDGSLMADADEGTFTLRVSNNSGGQIGTGGNVLGTIGGNVTVTELDMALENQSGGNLNLGGNLDLTVGGDVATEAFTMRINNAGGHIGTGGNIFADIAGDLRATTSLDVAIDNSNGGSIDNGGIIDFGVGGSLITLGPPGLAPAGGEPIGDANFQIFLTPPDDDEVPNGGIVGPAILVRADEGITIGGSLNAFIDDSGGIGAPGSGFHLVQVSTDGAINVANRLNVLGTVAAAGPINAGTIASTDVNSGVSINAGFGGIQQFELPATGVRSDRMHFLSAARVTSQSGIDFNGYSAVGNTTAATNGGRLTINATSMTFGGDNADIFGSITLNGGNSSTALGAGDGGELIVNTSDGLFVATDIEATSGFVESNLPASGRGGSVTLDSNQGIVNIESRIEVSSNDPAPAGTPNPVPPRRRSAQGGNITIRSGRSAPTPPPALNGTSPRTVAVNISNSSQLLALLDAAPSSGPGGKITILATGANTDVNVNGRVAATKGTIDIRHDANGGRVNFGPSSNSDNRTTLSADVIRSRALGANGQLNVGHTTMSADSLIRLYAPGSNGQLNFIANTTLSSGRAIDLAAGTVTIQPNVVVTIAGNGGPANVYTNNPNYSGFGGTNPNNGTFGGNGANTPQPLTNAPPFEAPLPPPGAGGL